MLQTLNEVFIQNNINIKWIFWLDFDERIDNNLNVISNFRNIILSPRLRYNILNLPLFHMWNEYEYNTQYPYSFNGIQYHTRLIRYKKNNNMIINNDNKLHFNLNHYDDKKTNINFGIKHLSNNSKKKLIIAKTNFKELFNKLNIPGTNNCGYCEKCTNTYAYLYMLKYSDKIKTFEQFNDNYLDYYMNNIYN